jgi:hypothetical protein
MKYKAHGFTQHELFFMQQVLDDDRAWRVKFELVDKNADFLIFKTPGKEIDAIYPAHIHGLSVCDRSERPWKIHFRKEFWDTIPKASGYTSLAAYRVYLILHEFGHILDHGHAKCVSGPAPVMMQQTLGTGKCYPDPWVQWPGKKPPAKHKQPTVVIEIDSD